MDNVGIQLEGGQDMQSAQRGEPTPKHNPEHLSVNRAKMRLKASDAAALLLIVLKTFDFESIMD